MSQRNVLISGGVKLRVCNIRAWVFAMAALLVVSSRAAESSLKKSKPAEALKTTNLWTVHFSFSADQWQAMVPEQPAGGMFGGMDVPVVQVDRAEGSGRECF